MEISIAPNFISLAIYPNQGVTTVAPRITSRLALAALVSEVKERKRRGMACSEASFIESAQKAITGIQAIAFQKKRERDQALKLARVETLDREDKITALLLVKEREKQLKFALLCCQKAKEKVSATLKKVNEGGLDEKEREECQAHCLRSLEAFCERSGTESKSRSENTAASSVNPVLDQICRDLDNTQRSKSHHLSSPLH